MTQMLAQREHDYFAETVICANCYIVVLIFIIQLNYLEFNLNYSVSSRLDFTKTQINFVDSGFQVLLEPLEGWGKQCGLDLLSAG